MTRRQKAFIDEAAQWLVRDRVTLPEATDAVRAAIIKTAVEATGGNITSAARMLGVHRNTIMNHGARRGVTNG